MEIEERVPGNRAVHRGRSALDVAELGGSDRAGRDPRLVRWYSWGLLAVVLAVGACGVLAGLPTPSLGASLLFSVLIALCMNRFVLPSTEVGVTAEAAVLFATFVTFRGDAPWLGPLLIALLVGPLAATCWERMAFVRMAYVSASRGIATLTGLVVFEPLAAAWGSTWLGLVAAAGAAAVAFVLMDTALGVARVVLRGELPAEAARHQFPINAVALPLALWGATAGVVGSHAGWWATFLMLAPVAFLPEIVQISWHRGWRRADVAGTIGVVALACAVVTLGFVLPFPDPSTLMLVLAVSVVLGVESRVDSRAPVPALAVVAVVASAIVVPGDAGYLAAALVAMIATITAGALAGRRAWWRAAPVAAVAAVIGAAAEELLAPGRGASVGGLVAALLGGAVFLLLTGRRPAVVLSCVPTLGVAVSLAFLWEALGPIGAAPFAVGGALALAAVAIWGTPPWRSRVLGPWASSWSGHWSRAALGTGSVAAVGCAALAIAVRGAASESLALLATAGAAATFAMAAAGVRQWRFAPRRRARDGLVLGVAAGVLVLVAPGMTFLSAGWSLLAFGAALGVVVAVAWPCGHVKGSLGAVYSAGGEGTRTS